MVAPTPFKASKTLKLRRRPCIASARSVRGRSFTAHMNLPARLLVSQIVCTATVLGNQMPGASGAGGMQLLHISRDSTGGMKVGGLKDPEYVLYYIGTYFLYPTFLHPTF